MAPDERRAAIIAATVPLLREHGTSVSTRQIADAAGVAEGTLFGVFPDKAALVRAALLSVFDPDPVLRALGEIDAGLDLRGRLVAAMDILRDRFERNASIVALLRGSGIPVATKEDADGAREFLAQVESSRDRLTEALVSLIEPDRALLRRGPVAVARSLFMLLLMTNRASFGDNQTMDSAEVVSLLLDGLLVRPAHGEGS
jgi:AcrR family transcriptional regulator